MAVQFLGSFFCDHCSHGMREPVWLLDGARLCGTHFRQVTGYPPPPALALEDLPPADPVWTRLVPGLRMRPSAHVPHAIELQACHNVQLEDGARTVNDGPVFTIPDAALVELVLLASAHRDDAEPNKLIVRSVLLRCLHGTTTP